MNDVYELVGIRGVSFTGSDGKQVEGTNLYCRRRPVLS